MINKSIIIFLLHLSLSNQCLSQVGNLDTNFGNYGISSVDFNSNFDIGRDVAIQTDGKILIAGSSNSNFVLARFNTDGTLDISFGNLGKVITNIGYNDEPFAIKVQNDGKIILAGYSSENSNTSTYSFTLIRYLSNGLIDLSFGVNGIVIQNFGDNLRIFRALAIQQDGKILASGDCYFNSSKEYVVIRFNINGSLDTNFGSQGIFHTLIGNNLNECFSIAIHSNGKILLAGTTGLSPKSIAVIRLNANGTLDSTFGTVGIVIIPISGVSDYCRSVNLQPNGKILLAGEIFVSTGNFDFALIRLNDDGSLDNTFGNNGIAIKSILNNDKCYSSILQSNGDVILIGTSHSDVVAQVTLVKFNNTGILDSTFGNNGVLNIIPNANSNDLYYANCSVAQLDGNIIIGGYARIQSEYDFMLMKIITNLNLGVLSNYKDTDLIFYPNPIKDMSVLNFELLSKQKVSIYLTDISGKTIKNFINYKMIPSGKVEEILDSTNISSGTYILIIKTKENLSSIKVIK